jgi:hypothetical protein
MTTQRDIVTRIYYYKNKFLYNVYYNNAKNEFLVKSNNNKTIPILWKESTHGRRYIDFYHPLLKEKSRIKEKEWIQDKEETIKHNIFLHELLLRDKHWNLNYEPNVIGFVYECYNIDFPECLLDKKYVRKTLDPDE